MQIVMMALIFLRTCLDAAGMLLVGYGLAGVNKKLKQLIVPALLFGLLSAVIRMMPLQASVQNLILSIALPLIIILIFKERPLTAVFVGVLGFSAIIFTEFCYNTIFIRWLGIIPLPRPVAPGRLNPSGALYTFPVGVILMLLGLGIAKSAKNNKGKRTSLFHLPDTTYENYLVRALPIIYSVYFFLIVIFYSLIPGYWNKLGLMSVIIFFGIYLTLGLGTNLSRDESNATLYVRIFYLTIDFVFFLPLVLGIIYYSGFNLTYYHLLVPLMVINAIKIQATHGLIIWFSSAAVLLAPRLFAFPTIMPSHTIEWDIMVFLGLLFIFFLVHYVILKPVRRNNFTLAMSIVEDPVLFLDTRDNMICINNSARQLLAGDNLPEKTFIHIKKKLGSKHNLEADLKKQRSWTQTITCHDGNPVHCLLSSTILTDDLQNRLGTFIKISPTTISLDFRAIIKRFGLTKSEGEVLSLMVQGMSNNEICKQRNTSLATVKSHINHLFAKLGIKSRIEAIAFLRSKFEDSRQ